MPWFPSKAEEVIKADYRNAATFYGNIIEYANQCSAEIYDFEENGLGPAKIFYLRNSDHEKFCLVTCHEFCAEGKTIYLHLKNQHASNELLMSKADLQEILIYLAVPEESIEWVCEYVL